MNVLVDMAHPAHVHLFKHFINYLKKTGRTVVVTSREKDVTNDLLKHYGIDYVSLSKAQNGQWRLARELIIRNIKILNLHRKYRFSLALGTSASIAHLTAISGVKSFVFEEDDDDIVPLFARITYPFATRIVVPSCLRYKRWKDKRVFHNTLHELAYLHPDIFTPDEGVLDKYGLVPRKYVIVRLSALKAHHDVGIKGLKDLGKEVSNLFDGYRILESREANKRQPIDPWDMHSVLYFAKMLVSDSQTMSIEAAVLGVPSIRYNSFVGRISVIEDLEKKYALTFGFKPGQEREMLEKIEVLLNMNNLRESFEKRRRNLLDDKENFTAWMINYFQPYLS